MKNNSAFPILLVLLGLILTTPACKKYTGPRTLTAQAVDKTTLQPVPDTYLYLLRKDKDDGFNFSFSPGEIMEVKQANAQGKAEFTFDFEEEYSYAFYAINKDGYFDNGNNREFIPYKQKTGEVKVLLQPIGFVKFHIKNIPPASSNDRIDLNYVKDGPFIGAIIDTFAYGIFPGNEETNMAYFVTIDGITTKKNIIVNPPALDTTLVIIEY